MGVQGFSELGALGVLLVSFGVILRWLMLKFDISIRDNSDAILTNTAAIMSLQKQLMAHDLTSCGINPASDVSDNETAKQILAKYAEIRHCVNETQRIIVSAMDRRNQTRH